MDPTSSGAYRAPFDFKSYIFRLVRQNRLAAKTGFHPCLGTGLGQMQDVLRGMQDHSCFVMLDDTTDGRIELTRTGGYFTTRVLTVFVLARYNFDDSADRLQKLDLCRQIFRQLHSRMVRDADAFGDELAYLDVRDVRYKELPGFFADGLTGLFFMITLREPTSLVYDAAEWTDTPTDTFDTTFSGKFAAMPDNHTPDTFDDTFATSYD